MDAKRAIEIAKNWVTDLFGEDGLAALRLEEIEKKDDLWHVTLGFVRPMAPAETSAQRVGALSVYGPRVYRVVTVKDADGEVTSVKIRDGLD